MSHSAPPLVRVVVKAIRVEERIVDDLEGRQATYYKLIARTDGTRVAILAAEPFDKVRPGVWLEVLVREAPLAKPRRSSRAATDEVAGGE